MRTRGLSQAPVVVVGSPRSGTSWLMRLIAKQPGYCTIFEPLHARWWPGARDAGFGNRPWRGDDRKQFYLRRVFEGEVARQSIRRPRWSRAVGAHPGHLIRGAMKRLLAVRLVVKFVRACRLLPWMIEKFPDCRYVYVIRNPYAVVSSQLSRGASGYLDDRIRPFDYLNEAKQLASGVGSLCDCIRADASAVLDKDVVWEVTSLEGGLALSWYADNFVAQRASAQSDAILTVQYEDLLTDTEAQLARIQTHIESGTLSASERSSKNPDRQRNKWRDQLSDPQIASIREVLHRLEDTYGSFRENLEE